MALGDRANRPGGRAAGKIGHIQAEPGQPVLLADRLTAATSPLAAFAGLSAGLLVLKMTGQRIHGRLQAGANATLMLTPTGAGYRHGCGADAQSAGGHPVQRVR